MELKYSILAANMTGIKFLFKIILISTRALANMVIANDGNSGRVMVIVAAVWSQVVTKINPVKIYEINAKSYLIFK